MQTQTLPHAEKASSRQQPVTWATDIQLAARYSVARSTIWRWAKEGRIPRPVKLTEQCSRWLLSDVIEMMGG